MAAGWLSRVKVVENADVQEFSTAPMGLSLEVEVSDQVSPQEGDCTSSSSIQEENFERKEAPLLGFRSILQEDSRTLTFWPIKKEGTARPDRTTSELERMGSGMSAISGCGGSGADSDVGEEGRRSSALPELGKLPSSQFKGVVSQPNGRWGAQIYEKHQRLWLGTFNEEAEAAKAYDRAVLKFRGRDAMTNFSPVGDGDPEAVFLNMHTKEQLVDMLRRHTYEEQLEQSRRLARGQASAREATGMEKRLRDESREAGAVVVGGGGGYSLTCSLPREHLFEKPLTPSDVGKLNRLVIPKQHAERCFPLDATSNEKGLLLNFEDFSRKMWRFRYSYWNSSQSYVLTKGWSRFVKEKKLSAGDVVSFERGANDQLFISCRRRPSSCSTLQRQNHQRHSDQQGMTPASGKPHFVSASPLHARNLLPATALNPWLLAAENFDQNGAYRLSDLEALVQQCRPHPSTISAAAPVFLPQQVSTILRSRSIDWRSCGNGDRLTSAGGSERGALGFVYQASSNGIGTDFSVAPLGPNHGDAGMLSSDRKSTVETNFFGARVTNNQNQQSTEKYFVRGQEISQSSTSRDEPDSFQELKKESCGQRPSSVSQPKLVTLNTTHEASAGTNHGLRLFGVDLKPSICTTLLMGSQTELQSEHAFNSDSLTLDMTFNGHCVDLTTKSEDSLYVSRSGTPHEAIRKRKPNELNPESSAESCPRRFKSPSF